MLQAAEQLPVRLRIIWFSLSVILRHRHRCTNGECSIASIVSFTVPLILKLCRRQGRTPRKVPVPSIRLKQTMLVSSTFKSSSLKIHRLQVRCHQQLEQAVEPALGCRQPSLAFPARIANMGMLHMSVLICDGIFQQCWTQICFQGGIPLCACSAG